MHIFRIILVIGLLMVAQGGLTEPPLTVVVCVKGLEPALEETVLAHLSIKASEKEKKLNEDRIIGLYEIAPQEITSTLEALGYYHVVVLPELRKTPSGYLAIYNVKLGRPTVIRDIRIVIVGEGQENRCLKAIIKDAPFKPRCQLNHKEYENFKQDLLNKALQLGYLDARYLTNEILVDKGSYRADILLTLDTSRRYHFGKVSFEENLYPDCYLRPLIPFKEGDPYTTDSLLALQKNLSDTDWFQKVRIDPIITEVSDHGVPLNVRLIPRAKNRYTGSLGYGTDTGARGRFGYEHRRQSHPGHRINADLEASRFYNELNLRYIIPCENPITDRVVFGSRATEEKWRDSKYSRRLDLSSTVYLTAGKLDHVYGIDYLVETYRILPSFPKKEAYFLLPNIAWVWSDPCPGSYFESGTRVGLNLMGALEPLLSSSSFGKSELHLKWISPLTDSMRFIYRGNFGAFLAKDINDIPLSLRFFAGGDHSVRGYGYRSLGPLVTDPDGNQIVIGGKYLIVSSIELEHKLYKELSGAVFYDAGNAMNRLNSRLFTSVGVGLRWKTPLGPFRLDVAQAIGRKTIVGKHKPRIHLTFGMDL